MNTHLLPKDYATESHKLRRREADSKGFFDKKPIFIHVSENIHRHHLLGRWTGDYQVQFVFSV